MLKMCCLRAYCRGVPFPRLNIQFADASSLSGVPAGATTTVYEVFDPFQLPFAVQCLVDNPSADVSVVVAIGFLVEGTHWCSKEVSIATRSYSVGILGGRVEG